MKQINLKLESIRKKTISSKKTLPTARMLLEQRILRTIQRTTMKDIAAAASVPQTTVSESINLYSYVSCLSLVLFQPEQVSIEKNCKAPIRHTICISAAGSRQVREHFAPGFAPNLFYPYIDCLFF